jgi:hypothetical protein
MIFGSGSPERVPMGPGEALSAHIPSAVAARPIHPAESVKRKNASAVKLFARPG